MKSKTSSFFVLLVASTLIGSAQQINFTVSLTDTLQPISPYIYGTNQLLTGGEGWTALRQGGNRLTGYNWENNASNAGSDYYQESDNYLVDVDQISHADENVPGIVSDHVP